MTVIRIIIMSAWLVLTFTVCLLTPEYLAKDSGFDKLAIFGAAVVSVSGFFLSFRDYLKEILSKSKEK